MNKLIPDLFTPPEKLETPDFLLRMLTVKDVDKDYDAVMTSIDHLQGVFGPDSTWPEPSLTLEQDLIDLGWHQKEFQRRSSFAYTVMAPDENICLGCMYIFPTDAKGYDAMCLMWVRKSAYDEGLDPKLETAVKDWITKEWPFEKVAYPGRDISWEEFGKLKE